MHWGEQPEHVLAMLRLSLWALALSTLSVVVFLTISSQARPQDYLGAAQCGSCHEAEFKQWRSTGHALAFARLSASEQRDPTCLSCHTMEPTNTQVEFAGVQCESCHGAGRYYGPEHVMRDKELVKLMGLETITEQSCRACHALDSPNVETFDYAKMRAKIVHKPSKTAPSGVFR